jgi:hypothetical protein
VSTKSTSLRAFRVSSLLLVAFVLTQSSPAWPKKPAESGRQQEDEGAAVQLREALSKYAVRQALLNDYVYRESETTTWYHTYGHRLAGRAGEASDTYEVIAVGDVSDRWHVEHNHMAIPRLEDSQAPEAVKAHAREFLRRDVDGMLPSWHGRWFGLPDGISFTPAGIAIDDGLVESPIFDAGLRLRSSVGSGIEKLVTGAWFKKQLQQIKLPLEQLPNGFTLRSKGKESVNGRVAYVIEARPLHEHEPTGHLEEDVNNFLIRLWIDEREMEIVKLQALTLGLGILSSPDDTALSCEGCSKHQAARLQTELQDSKLLYEPGVLIDMEWNKVNDEAWLPSNVRITGSELWSYDISKNEPVILRTAPEPIALQYEKLYSDYKKFRVSHKILPDFRTVAPN